MKGMVINMTILEAKETVIAAGKRLVESGLIARTWGNVSCRISDTHFVITPSGRDYISLTPEEVVEVAISDCSYSGNIKPSSEKGVHAEVYKLHSDVNFVIHTHQDYASAVSVLGRDSIPVSKDFSSLQGTVLCADYGLPGTKKLRKGVAKALNLSKGSAVIMKNHGALCFSSDYESTFRVATELEEACQNFIQEEYLHSTPKNEFDPVELGNFALSRLAKKNITTSTKFSFLPCESERTEYGFKIVLNDKTYDIHYDKFTELFASDKELLTEASLHNEIYKKHTDILNIYHSDTPGIECVSASGLTQQPLLDDFAQIAGTKVHNTPMEPEAVSKALHKASAVFLHNNGALCCAATREDAQAVAIVTEKNCNALISAALFGKVKYINPLESKLMRFVYLKKYSKQANHKS